MAQRFSRVPLTLALCSGYFLVLLDMTIVNVALPRILDELRAGGSGPAWTVDAYAVPLAALLVASRAIGDVAGHRRVVVLGLAGFGGASALCALAPGIGVLMAGRAVQGVAAALVLPGTLALLVDGSPDDAARNRIVGAWAAIGGAALLVAALGCFVTAIIEVPAAPWQAVGFGAIAVCALLGLLVAERRVPRPLLPVPREARRPLGLACLVAGLMNLCALGGLFVLTQVFQTVHRLDPLAAGMLTLPAMLPLPLLGAPAGQLAARIGVWRTAAAGLLVAAAGMAGIAATLTATGPIVVFLLLWGAGIGVLTPAVVAAALRATPGMPGLASGASNTARQAGGALGIALFAAVAGSATAPGFMPNAAALFTGAAVAFALAGLLRVAGVRAVT